MKLEDKAEIIISQLREDRDRLQNIIEQIRAEIDKQYDRVRTYNLSCAEGLEMALGIIDKYNVESEDKEIHSVIDGDFFKGI